jgi:hypothetical protein
MNQQETLQTKKAQNSVDGHGLPKHLSLPQICNQW